MIEPTGQPDGLPHRDPQSRTPKRRRRRSPNRPHGLPREGQRRRPESTLGHHLSLSAIAIPFLALMAAAFFCYFARPILIPLITAMTLAYILTPGVDLLSKKLPRPVSVLLVVGLAAAALGALGFLLIQQGQSLASDLPTYWKWFGEQVANPQSWIQKMPEPLAGIARNGLTDLQTQLDGVDVRSITGSLFAGLGSILSFLGWAVLVALLSVFILLEMPHMRTQIVRAMGPAHESAMSAAMADIDRQLRTFLVVKIGISIALGLVATLGLVLLGVPYAWVWGPLTGLLNIVPYVGALISSVPPVLMVAIQRQSLLPALWVALFLFVLQQIEGNVVTPKIMGNKIQLNMVAVVVSSIVWGWLWGALGVLLAIPITATMKAVCERIEPLRPIAVLLG